MPTDLSFFFSGRHKTSYQNLFRIPDQKGIGYRVRNTIVIQASDFTGYIQAKTTFVYIFTYKSAGDYVNSKSLGSVLFSEQIRGDFKNEQ